MLKFEYLCLPKEVPCENLLLLPIKDMRTALKQELIRSEDSRYDHRLHGVLLVAAGHSCYDVSKWFGHSPRPVQHWIQRFNEHGFAGFREKAYKKTKIVAKEEKDGVVV